LTHPQEGYPIPGTRLRIPPQGFLQGNDTWYLEFPRADAEGHTWVERINVTPVLLADGTGDTRNEVLRLLFSTGYMVWHAECLESNGESSVAEEQLEYWSTLWVTLTKRIEQETV